MAEFLDPSSAHSKTAQPSRLTRLKTRLANRYRRIGDEPVDDLGIPIRIVHRVIAVIFAVIGANIFILSYTKFGSTLSTPAVRATAAAALILSPLWVIVGRRIGAHNHRYMRHAAALFGTFVFCFAAQYTGELRGALLGTMLVSPIIAATAMPKLEAIPYVLVGAVAILTVGLYSHETGSEMRAVVLMLVTLAAGTMVIATRSQLVHVLKANRDLSETDPLTGAGNVRSLAARLGDECERASRLGTEFACAQFDLDEFKLVNDLYSHSLGDSVLVATAEAIQSETTAADLVARRGGDEFIVIFPAAARRDIAGLVAACKEAIREARAALAPKVASTASAGWVTHRAGETPEELLTRLDAALHDSKVLAQAEAARAGRGRSAAAASPGEHEAHRAHEEAVIADQLRAATDGENARYRAREFDDPMAAGMAIAWKLAAVISTTAALSVLALVAFGAPGIPGTLPVVAISAGAIFLGPLCWQMSEHPTHSPLMVHGVAIAALTVITVGGFVVGDSSTAGADLYLLAIFVLVFVLTPRAAVIYGAFIFVMYTYFMIAGDYPEAFVRVSTTTIVVVLTSGVIGLSRMGTVTAATTHRELAQLDALTGLPNLRQLRVRLDSEIRRCSVTGEPFALMMLDLDEFKQVNDRYSHSLGDTVLIAVADALRTTARAAEMPARRGGDEFAVVLTGANEEAARVATIRIGAAIEATRSRICPDVTETAGIGWVLWHPGESADDLLQRVDDALHDAKRAPRAPQLLTA
jgi:diguanylate cyclase (GGDEF)-like protein